MKQDSFVWNLEIKRIFAVIFFTSKMASNTEIISILSSGVSFQRMLLPFIIASTLIGALSFTLGNFIIPPANEVRLDFENTYLKNPYRNRDKNIHMQINPGSFIYIESYNSNKISATSFQWNSLIRVSYNKNSFLIM